MQPSQETTLCRISTILVQNYTVTNVILEKLGVFCTKNIDTFVREKSESIVSLSDMKRERIRQEIEKHPLSAVERIELDFDAISKMYGGYNYNNQLMMTNRTVLNNGYFGEEHNRYENPLVRIDAWCTLLVTSGSLTISVNHKEITVHKGSILFVSPFDLLEKAMTSPDGRFYVMMVKKNFMEDCISEKKGIPLGNILSVSRHEDPIIALDDKEMEAIKRNFDIIYYYLKEDHKEYKEILLRSSLFLFMVEIISMINSKIEAARKKGNVLERAKNREEEIIIKFMVMIRKHAYKEHNPAFFADGLFISVQYLSLILKKNTGHTASYWIANEITRLAKGMLRDPDYTIAQVAEQLHFADQSSFGKFFKKHTGISPKKYTETL